MVRFLSVSPIRNPLLNIFVPRENITKDVLPRMNTAFSFQEMDLCMMQKLHVL